MSLFQLYRISPALANGLGSATAGLRSVTQLDPCAAKTKTGNKKVLDQAIG
jgi:hypothetical protein